MADLRDRAAAVGVEIHELRRQAALASDIRSLVPLKDADRAFKREFGRGDNEPGDSYSALKERLIEQAYQEDLAEEQVIQRRIRNLRENVRREVEAENVADLAAKHADLQARADELSEREEAVAERERQARPSYRARFVAAGALLTLWADALIRVVA